MTQPDVMVRALLECLALNVALCGLWILAFGSSTNTLSVMCLLVPISCSLYASWRRAHLRRKVDRWWNSDAGSP